jgi:hypothetical protein
MKHLLRYAPTRVAAIAAGATSLFGVALAQEFDLIEISSGNLQGAENKCQGISAGLGVAGYFLTNEKAPRRLGYAPGFGDDLDMPLALGETEVRSAAYSVSDAGWVTGSLHAKRTTYTTATVWKPDKDKKTYEATDLHKLFNIGGAERSGSEAYGINNLEKPLIVGMAVEVVAMKARGYLVDTANDKVEWLAPATIKIWRPAPPFGQFAWVDYTWSHTLAYRVNKHGNVCGWQFQGFLNGAFDKFGDGGNYRDMNAFFYAKGAATVTALLPSNAGADRANTLSQANGINDSNYVVGTEQLPNRPRLVQPVCWFDPKQAPVVLNPKVPGKSQTNGQAIAIANDGTIVGTAYIQQGKANHVAVRWKKKADKDAWEDPEDLNAITDLTKFKGYRLVEARSITPTGEICGWGVKTVGKKEHTFGFKLVKKKKFQP